MIAILDYFSEMWHSIHNVLLLSSLVLESPRQKAAAQVLVSGISIDGCLVGA